MKALLPKHPSATASRGHILTLVAACLLGAIPSPTMAADPPQVPHPEAKPQETADWHKNEECRKVFFTVLEGLYRDGISREVVDLVIGRVESNDLERAFIFRCKLCHACYEAFAVYQRRPAFRGSGGIDTIGKREIPEEIVETLRTGDRREFDNAFAVIVQPWIRAKLGEMIDSGEADAAELLAKYIELANEGNALITGYTRCQACDAISAVAQKMDEK